jgi:tryptophanyl-tRNA synthetase
MNKKRRVFSGARPTGRQHLGNYLGAIKNYVALQDEHDCIYSVVDLHALTTAENTKNLHQNTYEMTLDWLAAGIRPEETIVFIQSHVPAITMLYTILSMVTQLGKLTDLPTFKEKVRQQPHNVKAADIMLYKANYVPVGVDQAPHIEFTREIARSFNYRYGKKVLIEPQMKVTKVPKVLGIYGKQKMSKSLNNHIEIAATPEETTKRVMMMVTDPQRKRRTDPGNPDICNVFSMHQIFSKPEEIKMINKECRRAGIGCVECKQIFANNLNSHLEPFRARRAEIAKKPLQVWDILDDGAKRARIIAEETIMEVREAVELP